MKKIAIVCMLAVVLCLILVGCNQPETPKVQFSVQFNSNGGTEIPSVKVDANSLLTEPEEPFKNGFKFLGWFIDADCTTAWDFDNGIVAGDMTLFAKWDVDTGEINVMHKFTTNELTLSGGLYFDGENIDGFAGADQGAVEFKFTADKAGTYALVMEGAKEWCDNPVTQLAVTVNGTKADENLIFVGTGSWGTYRPCNPLNIELQQGENSIVITRTEGANSDTSGVKLRNITLLDGQADYTYLPATFYYCDLALEGASVSDNGYYAGDFNQDGSSFTISITALQQMEVDITVNAGRSDDGLFAFETYLDGVKTEYNVIVTKTTVSGRNGGFAPMNKIRLTIPEGTHTVEFRRADGSIGGAKIQYVEVAVPTGEVEPLPIGYTVKFDSMGGTSVANQIVSAGGKVVRPEDPTKQDMTFVGWFTDKTLETAWNFDSDMVNSDITLFAKWDGTVSPANVMYTFQPADITVGGGLTINGTEVDGFAGAEEGFVELKYTAENAGMYAIVMEAAKEWCDNPVTKLLITVNGVEVSDKLICPGTGGWGNYRAVNPINIQLQAGENVIRITRIAGAGSDTSGTKLRNFQLLSKAVDYTYLPATFTYEDFTLVNASSESGNRVEGMEKDGATLSFDVSMLKAQTINFTVYASHFSADAFSFEIYIDGVKQDVTVTATQTTVNGRDGGFVAMQSVELDITEGNRTILIQKTQGSMGETAVQLITLTAQA